MQKSLTATHLAKSSVGELNRTCHLPDEERESRKQIGIEEHKKYHGAVLNHMSCSNVTTRRRSFFAMSLVTFAVLFVLCLVFFMLVL